MQVPVRRAVLQSPHDIGSYFAGFVSLVQDGITPSTQLKFRPKKNGIDTRSVVDLLYTLCTVLLESLLALIRMLRDIGYLYMSLHSRIMKSPIFTTIVPSIGVALIHWPSLLSTCLYSRNQNLFVFGLASTYSPPVMSCQRRVNSWRSV